MRTRILASLIHSALIARQNCLLSGNDYATKWDDHLDDIEKNILPSGSGVDHGTTIDRDRVKPDQFILSCGFHHMNDSGYYDGWTDHSVIVTPAFDGIDIRITGRNRNDIKDYLGEMFHFILTRQAEWSEETGNIVIVDGVHGYEI